MAQGAKLRWGVAGQDNGVRQRSKATVRGKFFFKWQRNKVRRGSKAGRCGERQQREEPS